MAKRKAARAPAKASARSRQGAKRGGARATGRKKAARRTAGRRPQARATVRKARKNVRTAAVRKSARLRGASAKQARKTARTVAARKPAAGQGRLRAASAGQGQGRLHTAPAGRGRLRTASVGQGRKVPALNRERRTVRDEDIVPSPPSSLDLDRSASAVRSGRRELHERIAQHNETSPALTGGDIDADWESAYSSGDEAPGGDNPTPDQDIVDDIGKAVGVQYEDNEELKGETKIADRDKKRWELDPASSEDYNDR